VRLPKDHTPERRACDRFPLTLELRYTQSYRRAVFETGSGRMIDMSSSGLRFTADRPLLTDLGVDIAIDWPALLDGGVQMRLIVAGVVVWTNGTETALRIERHGFRTRRVGLKAVSRQDSVG
jgi:PilZ domain